VDIAKKGIKRPSKVFAGCSQFKASITTDYMQ
jgi:hypothetical protein